MALQISPALEERLLHFAEQVQSDSTSLAEEGIATFLEHREAIEREVANGRAAAKRGELVDHQQAMALMDSVLANG